jgi:hypothetical protein
MVRSNPFAVFWTGNRARVAGLFALADQLEHRLVQALKQVDQVTPSLLARAWTHSLPARSGCALPLREILFTRSQRVQIAGQLVPQNPADELAEHLLKRIRQNQAGFGL